jgi:hypothetical protein
VTQGGPVNDEIVAMLQPLVDALGCSIVSPEEMEASDIPIRVSGEILVGVRPPALHGALDRLIEAVESEIGCRLAQMNREQKQCAIRLLDERGAFILRRAVEDVADAMAVSRITVYNYLNALHR